MTENAANITSLQNFDNKVLAYALYSSFCQSQISRLTIHTNQPKLALFRIEQILVPFIPMQEQSRIFEEIERHFSIADQIEKTIRQGLEQAERLRQSILKKAFSGKLVSQDPNDEPAQKLLERIKQEKERLEQEKKNRASKL